MNLHENLAQYGIDSINTQSELKHPIQKQETKESRWIFDKSNSMTLFLCKTTEINGSRYVKIPLRSSAILNDENDDKYCFLWSILAGLHPCKTHHPKPVSSYRQYFDELNIQEFVFSIGFSCSDVHKFEKLSNLIINISESKFYQDQKNRKHKTFPTEFL